ncbi:enoyl-CoA hydratase/isomerase family protein [Glaciimonas sp. PCH181]|uniref:enoyl-CoA hydratase/isomerase family protein n=1 Tax=Glaciimonas sp. PCH181 TaxID=2133943 RepID=UPI001374B982|nr:enoyl-CoA hydratase/isomerase family protein [Glaciimonas sp. PCH181]
MQGDFQDINCEQSEEGIFRVEIKRPPLNLLTQNVRRELGALFLQLEHDSQVRVVIFGSTETHFCAGADLKEFPLRFDPQVARVHGENAHRMIMALASLTKPTIAALAGNCMGGGLELALGCGFRIASSAAKFALPEIKRGVWPGTGGIFLLERLVGSSQARRLLLTGDMLDSGAAQKIGLLDQVVPPDLLERRVMEFARVLAAQPASSIRAISTLLDHRYLENFRVHLRYELELFVQAYQLPAAHEGNLAFFEKRAPRWQQS